MTSLQEIEDQIAEHERQVAVLIAEADSLRAAELAEVIAHVRATIAEYKITAEELGLDVTEHGPYYHPTSREYWSGRGPRPLWVEVALMTGYTLKNLQHRPKR